MKEQNVEIINGRRVLKKHVAAIQSSGGLSLADRKVANVLLFHARKFNIDDEIYEISYSELTSLLNIKTENRKWLKNTLQNLVSTTIVWDIFNKTGEEFEVIALLQRAHYKSGLIQFEYHRRVKPFLFNPEMYGKVNLAAQNRFSKSATLALYENCSRFRNLGKTMKFSIPQLKQLLDAENEGYKEFKKFNQKILNPAVVEVSTKSDIKIVPELFRMGRKITHIQFKIEERVKKQRIGSKKEKDNDNDQISKLKEKYGEDRVGEAIRYADSQGEKVKNRMAYILRCCEEEGEVPKAQSVEGKKLKDQKRKENQSLQNYSDMKREFVGGILRNTVSNLPDDEKNELKEIFKDRLKNGWGASEWSKSDNFCQNILIWEHNYNEIFNIIKKSHPQLIKEFDVLANKSVAEISSKIEEEVV